MTWEQFKGIKGMEVVRPDPIPVLSAASFIQWLRGVGYVPAKRASNGSK